MKVHPPDAGVCGSCWAFAAVGAIEGAVAVATGVLPSLSEQQLVSCDAGGFGDSCNNGGNAYYALQYVANAGGLCTSAAYPSVGTVAGRAAERFSFHLRLLQLHEWRRCCEWRVRKLVLCPVPGQQGHRARCISRGRPLLCSAPARLPPLQPASLHRISSNASADKEARSEATQCRRMAHAR